MALVDLPISSLEAGLSLVRIIKLLFLLILRIYASKVTGREEVWEGEGREKQHPFLFQRKWSPF